MKKLGEMKSRCILVKKDGYVPLARSLVPWSFHSILMLQAGDFSVLNCTRVIVLVLFALIILTNLDQVVLYKSILEKILISFELKEH